MKFLKVTYEQDKTSYIAFDKIVDVWPNEGKARIQTVVDTFTYNESFEQVAAALEANTEIVEPGAEQGNSGTNDELVPGDKVWLQGVYLGIDGEGDYRVAAPLCDGENISTLYFSDPSEIKRGER
jgi:hypothetical protein